jgi:hypothetical protein
MSAMPLTQTADVVRSAILRSSRRLAFQANKLAARATDMAWPLG